MATNQIEDAKAFFAKLSWAEMEVTDFYKIMNAYAAKKLAERDKQIIKAFIEKVEVSVGGAEGQYGEGMKDVLYEMRSVAENEFGAS